MASHSKTARRMNHDQSNSVCRRSFRRTGIPSGVELQEEA